MKKLKEQHIPQKYLEVLFHVAKNGAKTKYEIEKETHISHASVFDAVKFFEQKGILQSEQIGKTRIGLPLKKFKLTFFGVCIALKYANPDSNDYGKIIQNWKHLSPWLFGKFDNLVKKLGWKEAQWFFYNGLRDIKKTISPEELFEELVIDTILKYREHFLDVADFMTEKEFQQFDRWVRLFKEDSDFMKIVIEFIDSEFEYAKKYLEWANFFKDKMQNL